MAEIPQGYKLVSPEETKKARAFFDRGKTVAGTGNYDYAIEMYLQGLSLDPDAVDAHAELREIAMRRKASGGKDLGMFDKMKFKRASKDDKQNLLNAEKLLAFDPGNTDQMVSMIQNAHRAGYYDTVMWIGPILLRANADSKSPNKEKFVTLRDIYAALKQWKLATDACQFALRLDPNDMELQTALKNLGAQHTMDQGNYDTAKSFRDSIRDLDAQAKQMELDKDVRTVDSLTKGINDAEADWKSDPNDIVKAMKFVDALVKTEQMDCENRAIEVLEKLYETTKQFRFRHYLGRIKLAQLTRTERTLRAEVDANPKDEDRRKDLEQFQREKWEEELREFSLWSENYPTDMAHRFQKAVRIFNLKRYEDAIPELQFARQDPKYKNDASTLLGRAFIEAGYLEEAVDTFKQQIEEYQVKGDNRSKEMYYWYGRSLELKSEYPAALKCFSSVAMWDFNYRDVQARIKKLRATKQPGG